MLLKRKIAVQIHPVGILLEQTLSAAYKSQNSFLLFSWYKKGQPNIRLQNKGVLTLTEGSMHVYACKVV